MATRRGNGEGSITRRGDGRWQASIALGPHPETGKPRRMYLYGKTRSEVADKLARSLGQRAQGALTAPSQMTVGTWLHTWLKDYKCQEIRPSTYRNYERLIRVHLLPELGRMRLSSLRAHHVQHFYNTKGKEMGGGSVQLLHIILRGAMQQAVKNSIIALDPTVATTRPRRSAPQKATLSVEQVRHLLDVCKDDELHPIIVLAFQTGLRIGEMLALRWSDVDFKKCTVSVNQTLVRTDPGFAFQEPKTSASRRTITVQQDCIVALKRHKAVQAERRLLLGKIYTDLDLVVCREDGKPFDRSAFQSRVRRILKDAGLPSIRFHDIRHTVATILLEQSINPAIVQRVLGHSNISTTLGIYSHVRVETTSQATSALAEAFRNR